MEQQLELPKVAHVVCLPFPAQGHMKPMLKLAELLSRRAKSSIQISFINTQHNHERLLVSANLEEFHQSHPNIQFLTFSDGLPAKHPRAGEAFLDLVFSIKAVCKAAVRDLFLSLRLPPTCILADIGMSSYVLELAKEFQIPLFSLQTSSACASWIDFHLSKLRREGAIPIQDEDLDKPVTQIPGLENVLRYRDLPSICRTGIVDHRILEIFIDEQKSASQASALIINTFDELEAPMISKLGSLFSKIFSIGPLHCLLSTQIEDSSSLASTGGVLWKEDSGCLTWLDSQPSRSVVFVSFGSLVVLKPHILLEFWYGLVNSGKPFLWVIRPNSIQVEDGPSSRSRTLMELEEKTKGKGLIVSWAPQEKVLAHSAIGGFLTHNGWNSTLESIYAAIPMICWPLHGDQQVNSKCVSDIWRIGLDMKDTCDRSIIEKMVRDLLGDKRDEIMKSMNKIARQAQQSVMEGGSSYCNLEKLVNHIISLDPN